MLGWIELFIQENEVEKKDEWKTVGEKPQRKPHKVCFLVNSSLLKSAY